MGVGVCPKDSGNNFSEDVENLSTQRLPRFIQLLQQREINLAFARLFRAPDGELRPAVESQPH